MISANERISTAQRVSKRNPCPVCGKPDWCFWTADRRFVVCARVEQGAVKRAGQAGWLHRIDNGTKPAVLPPVATKAPDKPTVHMGREWDRLVKLRTEGFLEWAGRSLDLDPSALRAIGCVPWSQSGVLAFPMYAADGDIVGIRLRAGNGRKWAVRGSRQGVFMPDALAERIVITEGPTDTAAMIGMGWCAVGRPSCNGCLEDLAEISYRRDVIILADVDGPGQRGARELAQAIVRRARTARIAEPLNGKDAREWVRRTTRDEVAAVLGSAERVTR